MPARKAPPLSDEEFARFRALVLTRSGLDIPERRRTELERLGGRTLVGTGAPDPAGLDRLVPAHGGDRGRAGEGPLGLFGPRLLRGGPRRRPGGVLHPPG